MDKQLDLIFSLTYIDDIISFISDNLNMPIILEDDQYQLLSYSSNSINNFDKANQETILSKKSPPLILERFMKDGVLEQLKSTVGPFRINKVKEIGLNKRVVVSAKYKDKVMGYIWVQEIEKKLSQCELDFLSEVSFYVGKVIHRQNQLKNDKQKEKDLFFLKVIQNEFESEKLLKKEAEKLNIVLSSSFAVVVFTVSNPTEDILEELYEKARSLISPLERTIHILRKQYEVIVVIGNSVQNNSPNSVANKLANNIGKNANLYVGIGNQYENLLLLTQSYQEALEVVKVADFLSCQEDPLFQYSKLGVYKYLETIHNKNKELKYENEELAKLLHKDSNSQTELLKTLEIFLLNNCKLKPTAEQLFIHPNTLNYRIKQIQDLTNIDFFDFNMKCQLYIDLLLMKFLNDNAFEGSIK